MAIGRDTTAKNVQPLRGSITVRGTVGATVAAGEIVELQSDGYWDPADTNTGSANPITGMVGIALNAGSTAGTDKIDIVTHGPVKCLTGATVGAPVYCTNDAGEPGTTAGDKSTMVGWAESATVLYVHPQIIDFS